MTDEPYTPWTRQAPAKVVQEGHVFEAPPGLGQAPTRSGARAARLAAALLLWMAGFMLLAGVAGTAWAGGMVSFLEQSTEAQNPQAIEDARIFRGISIGMIVAGIPAAVAGAGILYRQPWARPAGIVTAALYLVIVPVGTLFGILVLATLSRPGARKWLQ